jgi:hypothetical protein
MPFKAYWNQKEWFVVQLMYKQYLKIVIRNNFNFRYITMGLGPEKANGIDEFTRQKLLYS